MGYILGLDLGSNSIGWACIDPEKVKAAMRPSATFNAILDSLNS